MRTDEDLGTNAVAALLAADRRKSRTRRIVGAAAVLLLIAGGGLGARALLAKKAQDGGPRYATEQVRRGDLESTITATGTVEALNTVEVGAEISGQITSIEADFNDPVTKGQLLVVIDPQQQQAAVAEAKAKVLAARAGQAEAKAALLEATQNEARVEALAGQGLASSKEREAATASLARAKASLESAKASAALAQATYESAVSKLSKTEIRSPIDGTVLSREVEVGQAVNAGMQTPVLFVIAEDLRRMRLSSQVDEADIGTVAVGQRASFTVDAHPAKVFDSSVVSVRNVPTVDQNVVSYEVLLSVDNSDLLLKPGMTATVDIVTEALKDALIVSNKALRFSPPSAEPGKMRRGPPMPLLGTGAKKGDGQKRERPGVGRLGAIGAGEGVVWVLEGGAPSPRKVRRLATDGTDTAVMSERLAEGATVITELVEAEGR